MVEGPLANRSLLFVVGRFPNTSETFIAQQIEDVKKMGAQILIYAESPRNARTRGLEVKDSRLIVRPSLPANKLKRILKGFLIALRVLIRRPALLFGLLDFHRFGVQARSLELLYFGAPLINRPIEAEVVICHFGDMGLLASHARELGLIRGALVTVFHGRDLSATIKQRGSDHYARLFSSGALFLPVSLRWKAKLLELGAPPERTVVHRLGVSLSSSSRRQGNHYSHRPILSLVSIARLVEKKGIDDAIRACGLLREEGIKYTYTIIGDGPLRSSLVNLANRLNLEEVTFIGEVEHARALRLLEEADLLLAPSKTASDGDEEGIPVAIMEAMARGVPVISTRHSGITELIEHGTSGMLVGEGKWRDLADSIRHLVQHPELMEFLGKMGREKVRRDFDGETQAEALAELIWNVAH